MHFWQRVFLIGSRAFAINFLLVLGLHPLVPVAVLCPLGTGFVTGWNMLASRLEGVLIGLVMGAWMGLVCGAVGMAVVLVSAVHPPGIVASDLLGLSLVSTLLIAHLTIFAGVGAIVGGHFARKEIAANRDSRAH